MTSEQALKASPPSRTLLPPRYAWLPVMTGGAGAAVLALGVAGHMGAGIGGPPLLLSATLFSVNVVMAIAALHRQRLTTVVAGVIGLAVLAFYGLGWGGVLFVPFLVLYVGTGLVVFSEARTV